MAKSLNAILAGKNTSKMDKVDVKDWEKSEDGVKFAAKHTVQKHADRVGNEDDVYKSKTKQAKFPRQDAKVYEEVEDLDEISMKKAADYDTAAQKDIQKHAGKLFKSGGHEAGKRVYKRLKGQDLAQDKMRFRPIKAKVRATNEETEEVNEAEKWIQKAIKKPGALHKQLGVPEGEKIPAGKLAAAAEKGGKLGKRARLAQTLKKLKESMCNHSEKGVRCEMHGDSACPDYNDGKHKGKKILLDKKKMNEAIINEVAPPGQEEWVKANKARFIKQYGAKKGKEILYSKAWKMHNENSSNPATNTDYAGPGAAGWTTGRLDTGTL